ncbi:MAG: hypothetical protein ACRCTG_14565 [Aestuariivirga sp.]
MATQSNTLNLSKRHFLTAIGAVSIVAMVNAPAASAFSALLSDYRAHSAAFPSDEAGEQAWTDRLDELAFRISEARPTTHAEIMDGLTFAHEEIRTGAVSDWVERVLANCIAALKASA